MSVDPVVVMKYDPEWPSQFLILKDELASDFADHGLTYISIEHVGSTAVPGQIAKPVIDIHVIISPQDFASNDIKLRFIDAMFNGRRRGDYHYKGDGGVGGRWSFKIEGMQVRRNVSIVAQGSLVSRASLAVRDTLRENPEVREKYGKIKQELAKETYYHVNGYSRKKTGIVCEILRVAGWTEEEILINTKNSTPTFPEMWLGGKGL